MNPYLRASNKYPKVKTQAKERFDKRKPVKPVKPPKGE
jgi:hypothetical protein